MCFTILFSLLAINVYAGPTFTSNATGNFDGYDYEYWKDNGTGTMTLNGGGSFSCSWSNINNILFRTGKKLGSTKTYQDYGNIVIDYACNYQPNGNSYMSVYGWTESPLVEYYIIESYGTWKPPGNYPVKGTVSVDGGTYEIYETTRTNQPSIIGTATFQQYWSIRTSKKTSGTISVHEHFKAWEAKGMKMGKLYEVSMVVEGYQSSGKADMTKMNLTMGGSTNPPQNTTPPGPTTPPSQKSAFTRMEAENFDSMSSSTLENIGNGVGYIESGDSIMFGNVNFGSGASSFTATVANGNSSPSNIEIRTGSASGTLAGTLSVRGTGDWDAYEEMSTTVSGLSGVKDLYLRFTGPVNFDNFVFGTGSVNTNPPTYTNPPAGNVTYGDVDGDGNVTSTDYAIVKRYILQTITTFPSSKGNVAGDVNGDGTVNSTDYALIKKYLLGQITVFPAQQSTPTTPPVGPTPTRPPVATTPPTYNKVVALTFDDGPSSQTGLVLDKLKKYNAKATFMVIGNKISSADSVMRRIVSEGHEIGNHSWSHQGMNGMSASQLTQEINQCNSAIQQYTGSAPKFFRAPNLSVGGSMTSTIKLPFVVGVIAQDWNGGSATTAQARANIVLNGVRDGSIVLMHCTQPGNHPTPEALDIIIPNLQQQGYSFVTLSELFRAKGKTPQPGVSYDGAF
jgi:peptidoglycan/xylan/chitin deacetylase (PgdA/CDA1 family)